MQRPPFLLPSPLLFLLPRRGRLALWLGRCMRQGQPRQWQHRVGCHECPRGRVGKKKRPPGAGWRFRRAVSRAKLVEGPCCFDPPLPSTRPLTPPCIPPPQPQRARSRRVQRRWTVRETRVLAKPRQPKGQHPQRTKESSDRSRRALLLDVPTTTRASPPPTAAAAAAAASMSALEKLVEGRRAARRRVFGPLGGPPAASTPLVVTGTCMHDGGRWGLVGGWEKV